MPIDLICLDADDTLWHCETHFQGAQARFIELVAPYADEALIPARLEAVNGRNLATYGYGAKGFTLSMIESALELGGDDLPARVIAELLAMGRDIHRHPVEPLEGVADALAALAQRAELILLTKGDLFHQEAKLAGSGLGGHFAAVEIVSDKTPEVYARASARHGVPAARALMAGNSVRSDIVPALAAGAWAALIPYPLVWAHEAADAPHAHPRFRELATLAELPAWVGEIS